MKTIRMPKELLDKWLAALRSGEYEQAKGVMYDPKTCGFCCLGVLQHVISRGHVEVNSRGAWGKSPSMKWLFSKGIEFRPEWDGLYHFPWLPRLGLHATEANDAGVSFKTLARAIEACAEGF